MSVKFSAGGKLRPHKMKQIELTVLSRDVDNVIEFLGRRKIIHFLDKEATEEITETGSANAFNDYSYKHIQDILNKLQTASAYLSLTVPAEPLEDSRPPGPAEETLASTITDAVSSLSNLENEQLIEKIRQFRNEPVKNSLRTICEKVLNDCLAIQPYSNPGWDNMSIIIVRFGNTDI